MELYDILKQYGFPAPAAKKILSSGITKLFPPQAEAIQKGALLGKNILMSVPTAAGKTFVAELCMLKSILSYKARCLYIVPLKALASEKYTDFKNKYSQLNIKVEVAVGDIDTKYQDMSRAHIIVATAEKIDSMFRTNAEWILNNLKVVVIDEIHFINDGERGPTLEILIARIKQLNPDIQLIALSATISNADELADWLNCSLIENQWRPIPLKEGIYYNEEIIFHRHGRRLIREEDPEPINQLTIDTLRRNGQVLIFVNSRRSAQAVSRKVCKCASAILTPEEKKRLTLIAKNIIGNKENATSICLKLAEVVKNGVAFHHAGLKPNQRELIEKAFRENLIKVISCTPTLAAGVNLPARMAIIRDYKRFENGLGSAYIPTSEYKQCAGRAGRPQYDNYGEAVIIAKSFSEVQMLFERYIYAPPEPITSKLSNESALRIHILASIASGHVYDTKGMIEFISHTFLSYQKQTQSLNNLINNIFDFLHKEKFIEKSIGRYFATPLGTLTSRLYIDPLSAIIIRDGLKMIKNDTHISSVSLLHLITCCPDSQKIVNHGKKDINMLESFINKYNDEFILRPEDCCTIEDINSYLSIMKTTLLLMLWIEEISEKDLCEQFNVGPGDIYRYVESAQRLMYAACSIATLLQKRKLSFLLDKLKTRLMYGVKEELLEIVRLKGIGRIRARRLFNAGLKTISDIKHTDIKRLMKIEQIGMDLAQKIIEQVK